jgi:phosphopentomutase
VAVGKIQDIFDGKGITEHLPAPPDDDAKVDAILEALGRVKSGLIFANLVDFDARYGHRRDPEGMAQNIERFDARLPELLDALTDEDLMVITADHGNDPTFKGTDHTRERVPLLVVGTRPHDLGVSEGFSDVGATVATWLGIGKLGLPGESLV